MYSCKVNCLLAFKINEGNDQGRFQKSGWGGGELFCPSPRLQKCINFSLFSPFFRSSFFPFFLSIFWGGLFPLCPPPLNTPMVMICYDDISAQIFHNSLHGDTTKQNKNSKTGKEKREIHRKKSSNVFRKIVNKKSFFFMAL